MSRELVEQRSLVLGDVIRFLHCSGTYRLIKTDSDGRQLFVDTESGMWLPRPGCAGYDLVELIYKARSMGLMGQWKNILDRRETK